MESITSTPRSIRRAWSLFCASGNKELLADIPADIAESWQRSRASGVDPGLKQFPLDPQHSVPDVASGELLEIARPILERLRTDLYATSALLTITNSAGRIVYRDANNRMLKSADGINSVPGALDRESVIGTNSVGVSLALQQLSRIDLWQHYCENLWEWADVGAPLIHPVSRQLWGIIDLAVYRQSLSPEVVLATKAAASAIQGLVAEHEAELHRFLLERLVKTAKFASVPALAVDRNGMIVCASEPAMRLLGMAHTKLEGRLLKEVRGVEPLARSLAVGEEQALTLSLDNGTTGTILEPVRRDGNQAGLLVWFDAPVVSRRAALSTKTEWRSRHSFTELVGRSALFEAAKSSAMRVAQTDLPVMLEGETGTGKELFAHAIHAASSRRDAPFVTVNCGTIPQELIASELFGYEKGAFTGASAAGKRGKFAQAHGGTLFLDEITETSGALQVSLLRALEDKAVVPVGAERATNVDVRVIAASNRDLKQALQQGALRRDLYYRLRGVLIRLPAVRERTADIAPLVEHFLSQLTRRVSLSSDASSLLLRYPWPGNVRELRSVLTSAALMAQGSIIDVSDLPLDESEADRAAEAQLPPVSTRELEQAEFLAVRQAMDECGGNVKEAAKVLGMARSSLYRRLRRFKLQRSSAWS